MIKFNVGISNEQIDLKRSINEYNDTSSKKFEMVSLMPIVSYTHDFIFSNRLSVSGKIGFQYLNLFYNNQHFGSSFLYLSVNPTISIYYQKKFEYYIKLQVGADYWLNKPELLDYQTRKIFPEKVNPIIGVTLGGFNYYVTEKLGLNLELSIWSPEFLTFGLSYRFLKGDVPTIQQYQDY
ncbi:MAG: hypothetical protein IT222_05385 [Crocinitomix sp.]|nr:hypothetical protein [Crocinitomix sp.]